MPFVSVYARDRRCDVGWQFAHAVITNLLSIITFNSKLQTYNS